MLYFCTSGFAQLVNAAPPYFALLYGPPFGDCTTQSRCPCRQAQPAIFGSRKQTMRPTPRSPMACSCATTFFGSYNTRTACMVCDSATVVSRLTKPSSSLMSSSIVLILCWRARASTGLRGTRGEPRLAQRVGIPSVAGQVDPAHDGVVYGDRHELRGLVAGRIDRDDRQPRRGSRQSEGEMA